MPSLHTHGQSTAGRPDFHRFFEDRHFTAQRLGAHDKARAQRAYLAMPGVHRERPLRGVDSSGDQNLTAQQFQHPLLAVVLEVHRCVGVEQQRAAICQAKCAAFTDGGTVVGKLLLGSVAAPTQPAQRRRRHQHDHTAQQLAPRALGTAQGRCRQGAGHACQLLAHGGHALPGLAVNRVGNQPVVPGAAVGIGCDARMKPCVPAGGDADGLQLGRRKAHACCNCIKQQCSMALAM
ncbi:hypothetical protein D3C79_588590 [compost metagenome]